MTFRPFLAAGCAALLAACAGTPTPPSIPARAAVAAPARPAHRVLLVSIDGLRADAIDLGVSPNLQRFAAEGVRARWMSPSYPSLTFPNHYSIVTGLRPDHHGIVNNSIEDAALGRFSLGDRDAVGDARWWLGEPVWVGAERAGIRTATWSWPGSEAAIDGVRPSRWRRFDGSVPPDARVDTILGWAAETGADAPQLMTLYFDQVDHAGHDHGPQSPDYAAAVAQVDAALGRLRDGLQKLGMLDAIDIVIVSDHGMATVPPTQRLAIEDMVAPTLARAVTTGQSLGFAPLPGQQAAAEARLLGAHPQYDCWRKQALPARWHYGSSPRVPPIVCQMHEGWNAMPAARIAARLHEGVRGSHGYDPALPSMRATFIARGPSFVSGRVIAPFDNVDVYPLLTRLLGIAAAPNDGDVQALLPALRDSNPAAAP
jgi:predicted AlkP superfamily pyrophosphatase or phosphodiesterase